jgi:membrane-associated phospholipid phosphatase
MRARRRPSKEAKEFSGNPPPVTFITDFADQAVILPLVVAIGVALLAQGWRRGAAAWAVAVAGTFAAMLALKLVFLACAANFGTTDIRTPSGHVAAATVVTGGLAALLLRRRASVLPLAALAAIVIGLSRLLLGVHSLPEVALGAVVGLAGAWALLLLAGRPPPDLGVLRIAVVAVAIVLVFHGLHFPAEAHIRATAFRFAQMLAVCQSDDLRLYKSSNRTMSSSPR